MALVAQVKLMTPLIVLVGGGVYAQSAVRVGLGMVLWPKLILCKGFRIVLTGVGSNRCRIQANEGGIYNAKLVEFLRLLGHDRFQLTVVHFLHKPVIGPVGRRRLCDVKAAVVGDDSVIIQIICQISDL